MSAAASSGCSGKPVWQKLGIKPGLRLRVEGAPADYAALVGLDAEAIHPVGPRAAFDLLHLFVTEATVLQRRLLALSKSLPASAVVWVSWPKKSSGVPTDVTEDTIRHHALPLGLVDIKVCAVDATWSGLKLVWRTSMR